MFTLQSGFEIGFHCPTHLLSLSKTCRQTYNVTKLLPFTLGTVSGEASDIAEQAEQALTDAQRGAITSGEFFPGYHEVQTSHDDNKKCLIGGVAHLLSQLAAYGTVEQICFACYSLIVNVPRIGREIEELMGGGVASWHFTGEHCFSPTTRSIEFTWKRDSPRTHAPQDPQEQDQPQDILTMIRALRNNSPQ